VAEIVEEALEQIVDPIIYAEAADLIDLHRAAGRSVVLVSASPAEIVVPLGRYLGADATIASRARVDEAGRYTGTMEFYAYGEYKAEAMRSLAERDGIDLSESYAYSDSYTDLPMLEAVGHPVAVNPDRVLARFAREHSYEITRFVQPVRLRDRVRDVRHRISSVSVPAPRPAIAVSAAAVGVGVGAFVLGWWLGGRRRRPVGEAP
jgi:phosphoserine phosphatase